MSAAFRSPQQPMQVEDYMTQTDSNPHMIRVSRLTRRYGPFVALDAVDLDVRRGEFVTLLGPSGSGKSTLLNLISGMTGASDGRIEIDGRDATHLPTNQRGLGMVFQNYALMPHMTVFENIAFPLQVRKIPKPEIESRVREVLKLIQLEHVADRKPKQLSGGQQQRISLARCIVYHPDGRASWRVGQEAARRYATGDQTPSRRTGRDHDLCNP
ncbi:ABC transporter ATP-binding protein [Paracoccus sp. (in: a-proteobacteria)]|uniref:ABC transporter ATP-binding protein n=1 Tax=Paracoccus sp. TaxID=267 RepID=UPI0028AB43FC|nr:ABC transporter ATP-binding protein [Paracoccus sp. (in: a-proteobacteria)]